jgi:alanine-synthesizing transaminase
VERIGTSITRLPNYQFTKYASGVFSTRIPEDRRPNALARALAAARVRGPVIDLTVSNPTRVGIQYPPDLLDDLANPAALTYRPAPFGLPDAREAIAETYARRGLRMSADRIVLTSSTSEAYSILFKLLCDPGHSNVLTPIPSYPLFDHLTRLDGVGQHRYTLEYHGAWTIDLDDVDRVWSDATRAVLAVSPNNPTGSVIREGDAAELVRRCAERDAALIVDEVFCDYPLGRPLEEPRALAAPACLLCRLGGLSKTIALPQVKLGWMALDGPANLVAEALDRLELVCDTYLSVSTPVQVSARSLLEKGVAVRRQVLDRLRANDSTLRAVMSAASGATVLPADGGWSAVIRVPATRAEEALVLELLEQDSVVVHPGYFFDFPHEAFLVISLLPEPETFARGAQLIQDRVNAA